MEKKYFSWVLIILVIALVVFVVVNNNFNKKEVACTQDAKICPDGSSVGRVGQFCEFEACPVIVKKPSTEYKKNFSEDGLYSRLYSSIDGGITWLKISEQYKGDIVYATDSRDFNIIYAADTAGNMMSDNLDINISKSVDAGKNWTDISKGVSSQVDTLKGVLSLSVDATNSNIINIVVNGGIKFRSIDGGNTWVKVIS